MSQENESRLRVEVRMGSHKQELLVIYPSNLVDVRVAQRVISMSRLAIVNEALSEIGKEKPGVRVISEDGEILGITVFDSSNYPEAI